MRDSDSTSYGSADAAKMQARMRRCMADFALARIGQDDFMTFSALSTEFMGGLHEMMLRLGHAPTEDQFVGMLATFARMIARGEHLDRARGANDNLGRVK
jgi:hypothetical protein